MENNIGLVEKSAKEQNGWTLIGVLKDRRSSGSRPGGIIAFVRRPVLEGYPAGTARYYLDERGEVIFIQGHYDLTRDDAMSDLAYRGSIALDRV